VRTTVFMVVVPPREPRNSRRAALSLPIRESRDTLITLSG
jgi:hypothetical protein